MALYFLVALALKRLVNMHGMDVQSMRTFLCKLPVVFCNGSRRKNGEKMLSHLTLSITCEAFLFMNINIGGKTQSLSLHFIEFAAVLLAASMLHLS